MNITERKSIVRTIRQDDSDFRMIDGMVMVPRAGFEISAGCPSGYRQVIEECVMLGWLKPVAHIRDYELMMDRLVE